MSTESDDLSALVRALLEASAPEQVMEISSIWNRHSPSFVLSADRGQFVLEGGPFEMVIFNERTMRIAWLVAHEAWGAIESYVSWLVPIQFLGGLRLEIVRRNLIHWLQFGSDQRAVEDKTDAIAASIDQLVSGGSLEAFSWPEGTTAPSGTAPSNVIDRAKFDIACIAVATMFLHELGHIRDGITELSSTEDVHKAEHRCDEFARNFLLENTQLYGSRTGQSRRRATSKRAVGIAVAHFAIARVMNGRTSLSHPRPWRRMLRAMHDVNLPPCDKFWAFLAALSLTELRRRNSLPSSVKATDVRELAFELANRVDHYRP